MSVRGTEDYWTHLLWQRHGLRVEEFLDMPHRQKLVYIASEICEMENPVRLDNLYLKALFLK